MARARSLPAQGRPTVELRWSERRDGDLAVGGDPAALERRRSAVCDLPWTWLDQGHGTEVVVVEEPGGCCGSTADAAVTTCRGAVLAVHTADCAPVLLWSTAGPAVVAAAHAGWRGLYDGVVESTVANMRALGAEAIGWSVGPHIGAEAYEFSPADLTTLALRFGPEVVSATASGLPALDLGAAVESALRGAGVDVSAGARSAGCTATGLDDDGGPRWFSWRARSDRGRQASLIWLAP